MVEDYYFSILHFTYISLNEAFSIHFLLECIIDSWSSIIESIIGISGRSGADPTHSGIRNYVLYFNEFSKLQSDSQQWEKGGKLAHICWCL